MLEKNIQIPEYSDAGIRDAFQGGIRKAGPDRVVCGVSGRVLPVWQEIIMRITRLLTELRQGS